MSSVVAERMARQAFFAGLSTQWRSDLAESGAPARYGQGERLFAEDGVADRFWLIESGSVALDMRVPGRGDQVIETLMAGTVLGWSWLHPPYRWQFGAVARTQLETVAFDAGSVRRGCDADPAFGYAVLRLFTPVIVKRLQATRLRVLDLYATAPQAGRP